MHIDLTDPEYRALAEFRYQLRRFLAFSETAARASGVEPRQHQVLLALRGLPAGAEPSVAVLADRLALRHHTVVGLLDRLEASGLVSRVRDAADRRRARVALTTKGAELLRRLSRAHLDELGTLAPSLVDALGGALRSTRRKAS